MHACMEEEGRGGGEDQRMWLHASLFVPHVWELLLVRFCLRSCRLDISFVPGGLRCYSVNSPEARVLLQPCHLQTWSEERRHHVEGGANLSGLTGRKKNKNTGSHTQSHKHKPIWANTKQKPWLWYKQAAHALEQSRFIDVVVCPLLGWCAERTRIQHELIITSVWSCLKKSRYTPTLHVPVCLCFVSECQTHHCVFSLHCLFIYIYISSTPTCLSLLPLPLSPQRSKCKNNTEICHFSPHFYAVVAWMGCQNFLHSHFKLGSLQQDCVGWVVYKCFWKY